MIRCLLNYVLAWLGYYRIDYGFACGRHWIKINGVMIAQSQEGISLPDSVVHQIGYYAVDGGRHWGRPKGYGVEWRPYFSE